MLRTYRCIALCFVMAALGPAACDHGLAPPEEPPTGVIAADIIYIGHPEAWPPDQQLLELRFVAMRFVPQDTADFLQLNRMVFSDPLERRVAGQRVILDDVEAGPYLYAGVAQKYGHGAFDWRPIGLVRENGGVFQIASNETTFVSVEADFLNPPPFPPPLLR